MNLDKLRQENNGELPSYAWPGGYPVVYMFLDGETCCPGCANGKNGSDARIVNKADDIDDDWLLAGYYIHWEGEPEICAHCGAEVDSAYGPVDD